MSYLFGSVGNGLINDSDDIRQTKKRFETIDLYDGDIENGYIDRDLDDAIKEFQQKKGLKIDGIMHPNGETETVLEKTLPSRIERSYPSHVSIENPVGNGVQNNNKDVQAVQYLLSQMGLLPERYRVDPPGIYDRNTFNGIKNLQEQSNLKKDGLVNPDGETIGLLQRVTAKAET